jgi:hypothetical protein
VRGGGGGLEQTTTADAWALFYKIFALNGYSPTYFPSAAGHVPITFGDKIVHGFSSHTFCRTI